MIKANELRIGNYFYNRQNGGGEIFIDTVVDILLNAPMHFQGGNQGFPKINGTFCENIEPIPLTQKLLDYLNFKDLQNNNLGFRGVVFHKADDNKIFYTYRDGNSELKSLHQL